MSKIETTLNKIRAHSPCKEGWEKLLKHLGKTQADDEPLPLLTILDSNGLDDTLYCLRTVPEHSRLWRLYAVWCARQMQHLMADHRSIDTIDVAERHANGLATDAELDAAEAAAKDTWVAARDTRFGTRFATRFAAAAAWGTAAVAAWDAAWDAAWAAAQAAQDAQSAQEQKLREILTTGEWK